MSAIEIKSKMNIYTKIKDLRRIGSEELKYYSRKFTNYFFGL